MQDEQQRFETWAIIDLFGHQRIAGHVSEATIGGCALLRVDVPEMKGQPAYTRYFGSGAIYSMTPCTEETARAAVAYHAPKPIQAFDARRMLESAGNGAAIEHDDELTIGHDDDDDDRPF